MIMKRDIKRLVNKYYKKVEQETISCGLGWCENDLKEEAEEIIENFYNDVVGVQPNDSDSKEYADWYKKTLVFGIIANVIGEKYSDYHLNFDEPEELEHHYGQRD